MTVDVVVPEFGDGIDEATVVEWLCEVGDQVAQGQPVLTLALDKVDTEVVSPTDGTLTAHLVELEAVVSVGEAVASVERASA